MAGRAGNKRQGMRPAASMAALVGLVLLGGCGGGSTTSGSGSAQAPCPRIAILADGADLTRFLPGAGRDLTAMTTDARIAGFDATCDYASRDRSALDVRVTPRFTVERGPAATERVVELPWFVALSDAGDATLLDRQGFTARVNFRSNVGRTDVEGQVARLRVPLGEGRTAASYTVRLSLQLTPAELALNRARGPR